MGAFRYQAIEAGGNAVSGVIEAADRKAALQQLSTKGIFASQIEACAANGSAPAKAPTTPTPSASASEPAAPKASFQFGSGVRRKDITAFTRQMSALLAASIPIPQALEGLGEEEENVALRDLILKLSQSVRKGSSLSAAMSEHPRAFNNLFVSMVKVGEEAGALPMVMDDLANLLEHEEEVRSEVMSAVAYPIFVLGFGIVTVIILLVFVLPQLFGMLKEMAKTLPLPTVILLAVSSWMNRYWYLLVIAIVAGFFGARAVQRNPKGALLIDRFKLRIPILGQVFMSSALSRFARTLGTLTKSGVSLLPALKIVEATIGNLALSHFIAQVSEETRGGDSLAGPLRKLKVFPKTVIQMIAVGEESGKLPEMLLKVAEIQERDTRAKTRTLVSLLAPALIMIIGAVVGFMVIALLLPILRMSKSLH
jgi:type II secretory pathway component PulF